MRRLRVRNDARFQELLRLIWKGEEAAETGKGTEKSWLLPHAEEMLALRCLALSKDGRWRKYWDAVRSERIEIPTRGRIKPISVRCLLVARRAAG